ncbi:tetratricopeptide repeat protein [Flagellimonas sp.]|uniref:tetratricopeptide repeat protein n=1 Tax=Flagellimonas sp. TaxID=2058762 RepID=UPI003B51EFF5
MGSVFTTNRVFGLLLCFVLFWSSTMGFAQSERSAELEKQLKSLTGEAYFSKANDIAETYYANSTTQAQDFMEEQGLEAGIQEFPLQHARYLILKGKLLTLQGNYEEGRSVLNHSITILQNGENVGFLAQAYSGMGGLLIRMGDYIDARTNLENGLALYQTDEVNNTLANIHLLFGRLENIEDNLDAALNHYERSIQINKQLDHKKGISDVYYRIAVLYLDKNNEEKALQYFQDGRAIKEEIKDERGLANFNLSLGVLHEEKGLFETALDYYAQSLKGYGRIGDKANLAKTYNNIGVAYVDWQKYDSAQVYHERSVKLHNELKSPLGMIRALSNLGEVHYLKEEYPEALKNHWAARKISETTERKIMMGWVTNNIGQVHLAAGRLDSASIYLNRSLKIKKQQDNYLTLRQTYKDLSELKEKQGDMEEALAYFKLYKEVQDSLFRKTKTRELAEMQARYDNVRQEKEIDQLQQKNKTQRLWQNIYAIGALLALIAVGFVFQFFKYKNKKNKELLAVEAQQRQQLEEIDRLKSRFFNNISHEFRTPLTLILGPLDKLRKGVDNTLRPTIDIIDRNGKRLLKLINQLLELSKIEAGKTSLKTSFVDVVPLLKGWVLSFQSMAEMKDVDLSVQTEKESYFLYIDKGKMEEVLINLLSNALKYTPSGGNVTVSLHQIHKDGNDALSIKVSDTGKGIAKEEQPYIFDRFYQAANADADNVVGTGIGLSLIKELVDLHKGSISVKSELGVGSTFDVQLPFGKEHLSEEEVQMIPAAPHAIPMDIPVGDSDSPEVAQTEVGGGELPLLLLIEDNEDLRDYIREVLKGQYDILEAKDGEVGIQQALEHIPDIIVSDLMMPKVDGLEVCKTLKEDVRTSHIPIVLLTARSSKEDRIEGLKSLADDYLTKPFDNEELLVRVENLIATRKKMQEYFSTGDILKPKKLKLSSIDQDFIKKVTEILELEIDNENFGVVELADAVALSRSQLFRKIKAITDQTPIEFIRSFRLHRAMDMLQQQSGTVAEIAYSVGFQNPSYFSKCFQEQFGMSPSAVSRR